MNLRINMQRPPLTSNDQRRAHWSKVRDAKRTVTDTVGWLAKADGTRFSVPVDVLVTWFAPDGRRRDSDSLGPFLKASLDGLVRAGVIEDDSHAFVSMSSCRIVPKPDDPHIEVAVTPVEGVSA